MGKVSCREFWHPFLRNRSRWCPDLVQIWSRFCGPDHLDQFRQPTISTHICGIITTKNKNRPSTKNTQLLPPSLPSSPTPIRPRILRGARSCAVVVLLLNDPPPGETSDWVEAGRRRCLPRSDGSPALPTCWLRQCDGLPVPPPPPPLVPPLAT